MGPPGKYRSISFHFAVIKYSTNVAVFWIKYFTNEKTYASTFHVVFAVESASIKTNTLTKDTILNCLKYLLESLEINLF